MTSRCTPSLEVAEPVLQAGLVDFLDGVPVQPGQFGDVGDRQQFRQRLDPGPQSLSQPGMSVQPADLLGRACPAVVAVYPPRRDAQPDPAIEPVSFTHTSPASFMHQGAGRPAGAAPGLSLRVFL